VSEHVAAVVVCAVVTPGRIATRARKADQGAMTVENDSIIDRKGKRKEAGGFRPSRKVWKLVARVVTRLLGRCTVIGAGDDAGFLGPHAQVWEVGTDSDGGSRSSECRDRGVLNRSLFPVLLVGPSACTCMQWFESCR